jgi:hypothetical protein
MTQDALQKAPVVAQPPSTPSSALPDMPLIIQSKKTADGKEKTRFVTALSKPDSTLRGTAELGKIYRTGGANRKAIHECYFDSWDDYILQTSTSNTRPAAFCPNTTANWKETYKGVIGYVSSTQNTTTNKLFKECFDETNLNHFYVTITAGCQNYAAARSPRPSVKDSWTYGYIR